MGFGILALCGIFSLIFAPDSVEPVSFVALFVGLAGLMTPGVIAGRASYRRRMDIDQKLLIRYCEVLSAQAHSAWRMLKWEQQSVIGNNGDTRQTMTVQAAVKSTKLSYYRLSVGAGWNQPRKYQNNVKVHVRSAYLEGIGSVEVDVTTVWMPGGKLEVLVHFPDFLSRGKRFKIVIVLDWPGKCRPLMKEKAPDDFRYVASRPLEELAYIVVLPPGSEATYDPWDSTRARSRPTRWRRHETKAASWRSRCARRT